MKLYYFPGSCSLSAHVVLREAGVDFELERVDLRSYKTASGTDFRQINPKGYVPALQLDDGQLLTEGAAILQYIADQNPGANLAPENGTLERARLQEYLNFIATELHKSFSVLFKPDSTDEMKQKAKENIEARLAYVESVFADGRPYLLGDTFSVADAYLFAVLNLTNITGISLDRWPDSAALLTRVADREKVRAAMRAEGLTEEETAK